MQYLCLDDGKNAAVAFNFKWKEGRKALVCLNEEMYLICVTYSFDLGL